MEMKPILTAHYVAGYRTPDYSGAWGQWKSESGDIPEGTQQHNPDHLLPNGERDIASVYMPVVGTYDSGDPDLCEYHILLAKAAGLDGFVVDWFGPHMEQRHMQDDANVRTLLHMANKLDFKIALCFEDQCCFPPLQPMVQNREQTVNQAKAALQSAQDIFFSSPAYLRLNGRPVLTTHNQGKPGKDWNTPFFTAEEWKEIRADLSGDIFLMQNYQPVRHGISFTDWDSVYPWVSVYYSDYDTDETFWEKSHSAREHGNYQFISGLVNPGYDDRGTVISTPGECRGTGGDGQRKPRVFSRRQGEKYTATWEDNLTHGAQFIQIGTWNHHGQGTGIEPVKEIVLHRSAAVPGSGYRELITTREYAVRFKQKKLWPLPALFLPERLYRLRKSGAPETRGDRIRLYLLEGDLTGSTLGLEHAGV